MENSGILDDWGITGHYGNGFSMNCPDCDWEYESPVVSAAVGQLREIAQQHIEEAHP